MLDNKLNFRLFDYELHEYDEFLSKNLGHKRPN